MAGRGISFYQKTTKGLSEDVTFWQRSKRNEEGSCAAFQRLLSSRMSKAGTKS